MAGLRARLNTPVAAIIALSLVLEAFMAPGSIVAQSEASSPSEAIQPPTVLEQETEAGTDPAAAERVEVMEERTLDSRTFQNADGTFTTEAFGTPIHYEDAAGELQRLEPEAVASDVDGVAFESKDGPVDVLLGDSSVSGTPLEVRAGDYSVSYTPVLPLGIDGAARAADREPVKDGGQVVYSDVHPGVDYRYTILPFGVKEDIVLREPGPLSAFAFEMNAPGLKPILLDDGSIELRDGETVVFRLPAPFMIDSADPDGTRGGGVRSDAVRYELLSLAGVDVLVIEADPKWLADPERVYPIYIDPTTENKLATADTFISSAYPSTSFNSQWNPGDGGYYEMWNGYYDSTSGTNYAYVKTSLPSGVTVLDADFKVYVEHAYSLATPTNIYLGKLTSAFSTSQTWSMTHPTWTALTSDSVAVNQYAVFDVTALAQSWISGTATNHGLRIYESSTSQSLWKRLRASENGTDIAAEKPPHLVITWTRPVATVVGPTGSAWTKTSLLDWTYSANGSNYTQTKYHVQVSTDPAVWTGTPLKASSGDVSSSATSWTAPTTNFVNGTTYYWRVKAFDGYSWSAWTSAASFKWDAAVPSFTSSTIDGAITAAEPNYYDLGNGTFTIKIRGSDSHSGINLTYLRLYNSTNEMRVQHDWSVGGTHCNEFDTSTLVDATACSESYNSGGTREVTFTVVGLNQNASFDIHYYFTDYAGNTVGYTDTGKNLHFDAIAPTGSISSPAAGATVCGTVAISGTASDANFTQYEVHYGAGSSPSSWTSIGTNPYPTQVTNSTLASWNTTGLATGTYTIRLIVKDKARISSGFTTVTRTLTVNCDLPTALITDPAGDRLEDGIVEISGTASATAYFANYTLHYGAGCAPSSWIDIGVNPRTGQVTDGLLGIWDTAGLTGDHTIRLVVSRSDGPTSTETVCVTLGSSMGRQAQHSFETWDLGGGDELAVNAATGNAVLTHPLVTLPQRGGALPLALTYNALSAENVGLGIGWQLNLQRRLVLNPNGTVTFVDADGARHLFTAPVTIGAITTYTRPASLYAGLTKDANALIEYTLTYRDGSVDRFDIASSTGRLERSVDRHGNAIGLTYGTANQIDQVTDPASRTIDFAWDGSGRLTSITDWAYVGSGVVQATATGSRRTYRLFHAPGGLLAGWSEALNTTGSCPTVDPDPYLTCLTYTGGLLTAVSKTQTVTTFDAGAGTLGSAARAITTELTYDDGRVASVTDAEQVELSGPATMISWDDPDSVTVARPTTTTGYELVAADDPYGRVRSVLRYLDPATPIERRTLWDVDFPIEPASVTVNYGAALSTPARTVSYLYQPGSLGLVSHVIEPLTASTSRWTEHTYNANHDVTQTIVSLDGSSTERSISRFCYDATCSVNGNGAVLLAQIENFVSGGPSNNDTNVRTDFAYDVYGQRTSVTRHNRDAMGAVLDDREDRFTFDGNGNLTAEIVNRADGAVTGGDDVTPNATTQARTDLTTAHSYDTAGNRISSADPRRAILAATGSPAANDYVTRWTYDALNRRLTETTPTTPAVSSTQKTSTSTYYELGAVRTATDFGGFVTATESDRAGRALRSFDDPSGPSPAVVTAINSHDADGRVVTSKDRRQISDANLGQTETTYDGLGRQVLVLTAAGTADESITETGYDALDRRTSYVVGGQATAYGHDLGGRVTATDDGFTCKTESFDYKDRATSTVHGKDGNGCAGSGQYTVTHTYDGLGRLTRDEQGSLRPVDDVFDAIGNRRRSAPVTETAGGGTATMITTFTVNLLDQVVVEARDDGSVIRTSKTTYDPAGNPVDRCRWEGGTAGGCPSGTNPPAQISTTTYDARNQRLSLTDGATNQTTVYDPDHNYQPAAVYAPVATGVELQTLYGYDERHRLTSLLTQQCTISAGHQCASTLALGSSTYDYDASDNRVRVIESADGSTPVDRFYCYDARDQLVARNTGAGCDIGSDEAYTYDAAGNRLSATDASGSRTFTYTADGQYTGATHDASGRFAAWNGWSFTAYDANGRLTAACEDPCGSSDTLLTFTYDADGRRTGITATLGLTSTTTELRYVDGRISAEYVGGVLTRSYVTDESGAIVKFTDHGQGGDETYFVTWNGHGDALNLLRLDAGTLMLANSFTYDTWGAATVQTHNALPDLGFRFRYVGQFGVQDDSLIGPPLLLMGARHYAPALGRFIQPDPAAMESNPYAYARNSPMSYVDPSGTLAFIIPVVWVVWFFVAAVTTTWVVTDIVPRVQRIVVGVSWWPPLGDQLAEGVLNLARSARDKLTSLKNAKRHLEGKLAREPRSPAANHWRRNLEGVQRKIDNLLRRYPYLR